MQINDSTLIDTVTVGDPEMNNVEQFYYLWSRISSQLRMKTDSKRAEKRCVECVDRTIHRTVTHVASVGDRCTREDSGDCSGSDRQKGSQVSSLRVSSLDTISKIYSSKSQPMSFHLVKNLRMQTLVVLACK